MVASISGMLITAVKVAVHVVRSQHLEQSLERWTTSMSAPAEDSQAQTGLR